MNKKLNGLYLPNLAYREPWQSDVVTAITPKHHLAVFDYDRPVAPQFAGIEAVIDFGGSMGTREMADAARSVKLWQILGIGFDHFELEYWKKCKIPVANCPGQFTGVPL